MCGRYYIEPDNYEMQEIIKDAVKNICGETIMKTGEIFPTNKAPVLLYKNYKQSPTIMEWGFPNYRNNGVIINARAETALEKRTFHNSLLNRRCVIPATGFYEWGQAEGSKGKQKYLFNLPQTRILFIAGFYGEYEKEGRKSNRFVILTTSANESMEGIHDRMPIVLPEENVEAWVEDTNEAINMLKIIPPQLKRTMV